MARALRVMLAAGALVLGASAQAQEAGHGRPGGARNGRMVELNGFMAPLDERALLERLHTFHQQEVTRGTLALANAQHPEVKTYARAMVEDHGRADARLMAYARGRKLTMPSRMKPMSQAEKRSMEAEAATLRELQGMTGAPFDSAYTAREVAAHDAAIGLVLAAQQAFNQGELGALLQERSQHLTQHRQQAYRVLGQVHPASALGVGGAGEGRKLPRPGDQPR
ncbi:MAG: DUF4142 domain-containing protein [Myxococcaceae bacterium]|nr:DUF4142 domain-containing protein [Myxococcaceae bacterium]MCI0671439.1 DUF4142 domain-containing protein [Myxococcaceae bacterium]